MALRDKPLAWLHGEIRTPPLSLTARVETGVLLRRLQRGDKLSLPHSRPMPSVGPRCHELRVRDENQTWRVLYRLDTDAVLILEVFSKKSEKTPRAVIDATRLRLRAYDQASGGEDG